MVHEKVITTFLHLRPFLAAWEKDCKLFFLHFNVITEDGEEKIYNNKFSQRYKFHFTIFFFEIPSETYKFNMKKNTQEEKEESNINFHLIECKWMYPLHCIG